MISFFDDIFFGIFSRKVCFYLLQQIIFKTGATLLYAQNGKQAVDICNESSCIDLVLMDMVLPEMDGFEATRKIKMIRNDLPVIAHTSLSINEDKGKCLETGCEQYLAKPIDKWNLLVAIDEYLTNK